MTKSVNDYQKVWAIGDLHLSIGLSPDLAKPMDVFGDHWLDHTAQIEEAWQAKVGPTDIVLLPGDLCWGNKLEDVLPSLDWLESLPGQKILCRGNHDNWWQSIRRLRDSLPASIQLIHNDCVVLGNMAFAGSRGWSFYDQEGGGHQAKMIRREVLRLEASLSKIPEDIQLRFALMHFPPFKEAGEESIFTQLLAKYQINYCVYGHLHGPDCCRFQKVSMGMTEFQLVSSDYLDFSPVNIYNKY